MFKIQGLEAADFADVRPLFAPLMHTVRKEERIDQYLNVALQMCLVYSSSEFYNTTDRIIVLMQVLHPVFLFFLL